MNADELVERYLEGAKRQYMERGFAYELPEPDDEYDADYWNDREAFRRHIEEDGEEEGITYLF